MKGDLSDYIAYRLSRASQTFNDAKILAKNKSWNSCVNRLYYSSFYAVTALLICKGFEAKTIIELKTIFFREFILTGIIEKEYGNLYSDLMDWRSEGDYADFTEYDEVTVAPLIGKTESFIEFIEKTVVN